MSHSNAVTYGDCRENNGRAACHSNAEFNSINDFVDVHMAGNNFVIRADNTDKRPCLFFIRQTQCVIQTAVGCILKPMDYIFFRHKDTSH